MPALRQATGGWYISGSQRYVKTPDTGERELTLAQSGSISTAAIAPAGDRPLAQTTRYGDLLVVQQPYRYVVSGARLIGLGRGGMQLRGSRENSMIMAACRNNLNPQRHACCESKGHRGRWATRQSP